LVFCMSNSYPPLIFPVRNDGGFFLGIF
jgi:hypothetical protein